ncbi:MAG: response regulator [Acidobacteria bacterium]|nr:response regulator [Acidobacteriota bacterium]
MLPRSHQLRLTWDVMVVDDDDDVRELIVSFFQGRGMAVTSAHDGRAAIAELERSSGRYGMVVTDVNLPGADGFAVLEAARRVNASCYVVVVTGYASLESAIMAVRGGAYDYLPKPFALGQLEVILQRVADRASLERENRRLAAAQPQASDRGTPPLADIEARLAAIELALARIETAVGVTAPGSRIRR